MRIVNLWITQQPLRALWPQGALLTSRGGMYSIDITYYIGIVNLQIIWVLWPEGALLTSALWPEGALLTSRGDCESVDHATAPSALWPEGALLTSSGFCGLRALLTSRGGI